MFVATVIVTVLLAGALAGSAYIKITRREPYVQGYVRVGVPMDKLNQLAALLIAGAAGLLLGLLWPPIGIAAAIGVILYFLLAVFSHVRADDVKNAPASAGLAAFAVVALILRLATM